MKIKICQTCNKDYDPAEPDKYNLCSSCTKIHEKEERTHVYLSFRVFYKKKSESGNVHFYEADAYEARWDQDWCCPSFKVDGNDGFSPCPGNGNVVFMNRDRPSWEVDAYIIVKKEHRDVGLEKLINEIKEFLWDTTGRACMMWRELKFRHQDGEYDGHGKETN